MRSQSRIGLVFVLEASFRLAVVDVELRGADLREATSSTVQLTSAGVAIKIELQHSIRTTVGSLHPIEPGLRYSCANSRRAATGFSASPVRCCGCGGQVSSTMTYDADGVGKLTNSRSTPATESIFQSR